MRLYSKKPIKKEKKPLEPLNPRDDKIKHVYTDKDNRVEKIVFKDDNEIFFKDFIQLFKLHLRTIIAGEVVSWDDVFRFQKQTDAKSMEDFLENVELEGTLKGSRFTLTRSQKMSLGAMIILLMTLMLVGVVLLSVIK